VNLGKTYLILANYTDVTSNFSQMEIPVGVSGK
jgi:hypothetical protein